MNLLLYSVLSVDGDGFSVYALLVGKKTDSRPRLGLAVTRSLLSCQVLSQKNTKTNKTLENKTNNTTKPKQKHVSIMEWTLSNLILTFLGK